MLERRYSQVDNIAELVASYDVRALNHVICFLRFQSLHFWSYFLGNMMIKFLPLYLRQHSWNFWNFVAVTSKFRPKIMSLFSLLRQNLTMMTANFCCNKNALFFIFDGFMNFLTFHTVFLFCLFMFLLALTCFTYVWKNGKINRWRFYYPKSKWDLR